jgi:Rrf2 family protein
MKLTAHDDYGLRCLTHVVRAGPANSVTINEIAGREALSTANVAKIMRSLREAGLVESIRGQKGGYRLTRPPREIRVSEVLEAMGQRLYSECVCERYAGHSPDCVRVGDCSIRALWSGVDRLVQAFFESWTLADLGCREREMDRRIDRNLPALLRVAKRSTPTSARRA